MADRVNIDRKLNAEIIKGKIDAKNILGLGKKKNEDEDKVERIDIFLLAVALGVNEKKKTPSSATEGLIQENPIRNRPGAMSSIYSILANDLIRQDNIKAIDNKKLAFETAEEYANTGLLKLKQILDLDTTGCTDEDYIYKMLAVLDEKYAELFPEKN